MPKGLKYQSFQEEWKQLYESGMSFREISKKYNVDAKTVNRTLEGLVEIRPKSHWDQYGPEWLELYNERGWSKKDIATKHGVSANVVQRVLENMGIPPKIVTSKRKYLHLVDEFVSMYNAGLSLAEIGEKFSVDKQTVLNYLNDEGVEIRDLSEAIRVLPLNEHYFDEIDTGIKAYHLGLLFGTGSALRLHNSYSVQFTIHIDKKYIIQPLVDYLRGEDVGGYIGADQIVRYRLNSNHLYETLKHYGFDEKPDMKFPSLSNEHYPWFMSGYFMAKGYFVEPRHDLYITGSQYFLRSLKTLLSEFLPSEKIHLYTITENEHRMVIFEKSSIEKFMEWVDVF